MAVYTVGFYASDPSGIFSNTVGNTFTWTGSSTATGQATITDNEAGVEGTTLDDDNNGGETATADVTIGGNTSTSTTVDAELVWTIQDTVTGETFEVAQFDVENGAASGRYTLSEVPLVAGRTYETLAYNSNPDVTAGDIAFSATDYVAPDGIVTGTDSDDVIDSSYTADTDGDVIDDGISNGASGNDDSIEALGGNDIIDAGAGDDTIDGGTGADTIEGGQGADSILGGTGEDTIYGDSNGTVEGNTSTFEWDGQGIADETSVTGGVTGTTVSGDIQVAMSVTQEANFTGASMETNDPLYDYNDLSDTSSIELFGGSAGTDQNAATMTLDFSSTDATSFEDEVTNVTFGIFDIDELVGQFLDQVVITAYDADGNPVVVTLTAGDSSTLNVDNTTGTATAIGGSGGAGSTDSQTGFLEVFVAGPVSQIVIDYNNVDTAYGNHAIRIGDIELTSIPATDPTLNGDNISGGDDDDTIYAGEGDDTAAGDAGNDTIYGEDGDDTLSGGADDDLIYGGIGDDSVDGGTGADTVYGGDGSDTVELGDGDDTFGGFSTEDGDDTVYGGAGNDSINGGNDDDEIYGGADDDTLTGASGNDTLYGGTGDDTFTISDDHDGDIIVGGEDVGDGDVDVVDFGNTTSTAGVTVTSTGDEAGTYDYDGTTGTGSFVEIEEINTTDYDDTVDMSLDGSGTRVSTNDGDDTITTGSGDDTIDGGQGADTFNAGAGNDQINLGDDGAGSPDGDEDVIVLEDGFGDDIVTNFDAPTSNGDGTFTGIDTLDVSGLFDLPVGDPDRTPVLTNDVDVTDDGFGNAVLTFPNGETITLNGVSATAAADPFYLNAIGIPMPDGTVSGTAGNDLIDASYTGDPDGDIVDGGDAILTDDTDDDDLIEAGAGDDTVYAGEGGDEIYGGTGDDTLYGNAGNDTVFGEAGNDSIYGGTGADTLYGGAGDDELFMRDGNDAAYGGDGDDIFLVDSADGTNSVEGGEGDETEGDTLEVDASVPVSVIASGDEAGTLTTGTTTVDFSEIEIIQTGTGNDTIDISADTSGMTILAEAGSDTVYGGSGDDEIYGGSGNDVLDGNAGADTLSGGAGNDTIIFSEGDSATGGSGDDLFVLEDLGETTNGAITIDGGSSNETGGDTLQLGGLASLTEDIRSTFTNDGTDSYSGTITLNDGTILTFSEIENIICFTPNTRIATPNGLVEIQDLEVGDLVVTRDHGLQPIRWVEGRTVPAVDRFAPVRIRQNVLEGQDRDLIVSPQHRVLFQGYRAELLFGESEVLVAAAHLVDGMDVTQDEAEMVTYVHILFDHHEVIYAEGAATESFHPGEIGFSAVGNEAREELFGIFPELRVDPRAYGSTARRCLKPHEAKLIRT